MVVAGGEPAVLGSVLERCVVAMRMAMRSDAVAAAVAVMRRGSVQGVVVVICAVLLAGGSTAQAANGSELSGGTWHKAVELAGPAGFVDPYVQAVSCESPGNCAAGGAYGVLYHFQAFVVSEQAGRWRRAVEVPGTTALNTGGFAQVTSVSCPSPGACTAYGTLATRTDPGKMFVVSEIGGRWGRAIALPAEGDFLAKDPLSCPSAGNCVAGGSIRLNGGRWHHAAVVSQIHGRWGPPLSLSRSFSEVDAVSCTSAGNCTASGTENTSTFDGMFAVSEQAGRWGQPVRIPLSPALTALHAGANAIDAMSCASAGNCAITGTYEWDVGQFVEYRPFVVSETGG